MKTMVKSKGKGKGKKIAFLAAAAFAAVMFFTGEAKAQGPTPVPPDCVVFINSWTTAQSSASFNNTFTGCVSWTLQYAAVGFTGLTLTVQSANAATATTPGTFGTFAGSVATGVNPNTSTTGAITVLSNGTVSIPWIRVRLSGLTGTGTVIGILYGYKTGYTGGAGVASNCPGGATGEIQYYAAVATCGGFGHWDGSHNYILFDGAAAATGNSAFAFSTDLVNGDPDCGALFYVNCGGLSPSNTMTSSGTFGPYISLHGVVGGYTFITTTGTGGGGGEVDLIGGNGGSASFAAVASTGGDGGGVSLQTGNGGSAVVAGTGTNVGGNGGDVTFRAQQGGSAVGGSSNTGGNGGSVITLLGSGGTGSTADGADGIAIVRGGSRGNSDLQEWQLNDGTVTSKIDNVGRLNNLSVLFAALATPSDAAQVYCSDCTVTSGIDNTCANGGSGAAAFRVNGAWKCVQ